MNINERLAEWIRKQPEDWVVMEMCPHDVKIQDSGCNYSLSDPTNYECCRKCWDEALK